MSLLSSLSSTSLLAKSAVTVTAVTVVMLAAVACSRPKEEPLSQTTTTASVRSLASCETIAETGSCSDYSSASGSFQLERSLCRSARGTFALNACPIGPSRVGACLIEPSEVKRYYTYARAGEHGFTADTARSDCEQNGLNGRFVSDRRASVPQEPRDLAAR